jgi:hypothetical protein
VENYATQNIHITFGCSPRSGVLLESTIAKNYVKCLTEFIEEHAGVLVLPKALGTSFIKKYEPKCEYREKVTSLLWVQDLILKKGNSELVSTNRSNSNAKSKFPKLKH